MFGDGRLTPPPSSLNEHHNRSKLRGMRSRF